MRARQPFRYPEEQVRQDRRAVRLEYATLFFMTTIIVAMYFSLGGSQAMRTAWLEDILGLVPASCFLIAHHFMRKPPSEEFPFGFYKASTLAYLVSSTAVLFLGLYIIYDAGMALINLEHPTIGLISIFGFEFWMGWLMIATLTYSMIPPVILGRMKLPLARAINDPTLLADAEMQKADWLTALAAIVGILGIGFGLWWADAVAALVIAFDVLKDGGRHVRRSLKMLADESPKTTEQKPRPSPVLEQARSAVDALPWVEQVEIQLREEGPAITGTVFVVPRPGTDDLVACLADAQARLHRVSWRLYDVAVVPQQKQSAEKAP